MFRSGEVMSFLEKANGFQEIGTLCRKMAQRFDCEIIALDVTDGPLQFSGDRKERESNRFQEVRRLAKFECFPYE